jgi:pimeloyl-ACP methyl ester carboxylesterase
MRPETGFADVNGTRLYYEVAGSGAPLVLMHGFSLDTRMWEPQWEPLLQRHQVLRYDLRGFGRSAPPRGAPYLHHEDLKALLDRLGIVSPALLGHSTGGSVALDFAVSYPDATRALVLFGSIAGGFAFSPEFAARWAPSSPAPASREWTPRRMHGCGCWRSSRAATAPGKTSCAGWSPATRDGTG